MPAATPENINDHKTWPPGSLMLYSASPPQGVDDRQRIGLVITNDKIKIDVIWDATSRIKTYTIKWLNNLVISKI